jgi:hypothetical protein
MITVCSHTLHVWEAKIRNHLSNPQMNIYRKALKDSDNELLDIKIVLSNKHISHKQH